MKTALDLNSNFALAYHGLAFAFLWSGEPRDALPLFRRAIRQSPHDPLRWGFETFMGIAHIYLHEYEEAVELLARATRHPNSGFWPQAALAMAFVDLNQLDDAYAALGRVLSLRPELSLSALSAMTYSLNPIFKDHFINALREAGLPE